MKFGDDVEGWYWFVYRLINQDLDDKSEILEKVPWYKTKNKGDIPDCSNYKAYQSQHEIIGKCEI